MTPISAHGDHLRHHTLDSPQARFHRLGQLPTGLCLRRGFQLHRRRHMPAPKTFSLVKALPSTLRHHQGLITPLPTIHARRVTRIEAMVCGGIRVFDSCEAVVITRNYDRVILRYSKEQCS